MSYFNPANWFMPKMQKKQMIKDSHDPKLTDQAVIVPEAESPKKDRKATARSSISRRSKESGKRKDGKGSRSKRKDASAKEHMASDLD